MKRLLPYDPGPLPRAPSPKKGEKIKITLPGLPPYKEERASIRNPKHPRYAAFMALRNAAIRAMAGRAWYFGPIRMNVSIRAPSLPKKLRVLDFVAGIEDSVDGSHGFGFTYLPIVFEDDCQISDGHFAWDKAPAEEYTVVFEFL